MSMPGMSEWLIILAVLALLFGGKRLPELGSAVGESLRNFKKGVKDATTEPPTAPLSPSSTELVQTPALTQQPDEKKPS